MKYFVLTIFCFGILGLPIWGDELAAPSIINYTTEEEVKVVPTGALQNFVTPGYNNADQTPANTAAAQLAVPNQRLIWTPSPRINDFSGSAYLIDAAVSPDASVLVIVERLGGVDKPNSSRLIVVNLHNGKVLRGIDLPQIRVEKIIFPRNKSLTLFALNSVQDCFKVRPGLLEIDLKSSCFKFLAELKDFAPANLAHNGQIIAWSGQKGHKIYYRNSGTTQNVSVEAELNSPVLAFTPDGKILVAASPQYLDYFQVESGVLRWLNREKLPIAEAWKQMIALDNSGRSLVLFPQDGAVIWFNHGQYRTIAKHAAGFGAYDVKTRQIFAQQILQGRLLTCTLPEMTMGRMIRPVLLRPRSQAELFRLFLRQKPQLEVIALDRRGNVFRLIPQIRRWKKEFIYIADHTGIR